VDSITPAASGSDAGAPTDISKKVFREVIAEGSRGSFENLIPIVEFLVDRGHRPLVNQGNHGFFYLARSRRCWLGRRITEEVWQEVQEHFVLPPSIVYQPGLIIDQASGVRIVGWNRVILDDGIHPVSVWEERGCPEVSAEPAAHDTFPAVIARMPPLEGPASLPGALIALLRGSCFARRARIGRAVLLAYFVFLIVANWGSAGYRWTMPVLLLLVLALPLQRHAVRHELSRGFATLLPRKQAAEGAHDYRYEYLPESKGADDAREQIGDGAWTSFEHLIPLVRFLTERGHQPMSHADTFGFRRATGYAVCRLSGTLTLAEWQQVGERFATSRIYFCEGQICDPRNHVYIIGGDQPTDSRANDQPTGVWDRGEDQREAELARTGDTREIIPAGRADFITNQTRFFAPVLTFLIERGHVPLDGDEHMLGGDTSLTRIISPVDWAAVNDRFAIPDNLTYLDGMIRDNANRFDVDGFDELSGLNGEVQCIEIWEESQPQKASA
jgi:hypothetical protein